jgi:hypothetical protein
MFSNPVKASFIFVNTLLNALTIKKILKISNALSNLCYLPNVIRAIIQQRNKQGM